MDAGLVAQTRGLAETLRLESGLWCVDCAWAGMSWLYSRMCNVALCAVTRELAYW